MDWTHLGAVIAFVLSATASAQDAPPAAAAHYYSLPAETREEARPWVVLLPGGSGISVFEDDHFYFDVARRWNALGFDALVVHYQAAARLVEGAGRGRVGEREARVVADALAVAAQNGWIDRACPGIAVGWSLGGEGALALASDAGVGLAAAIAWYPSVRGQRRGYRAAVPVLVLQGEADRVTPPARLERFLARSANPAMIRVERFPDAIHGFDIPSLVTPREFNGAEFLHHPAAATAATAEAEAFAHEAIARDPRSGSCPA